MTIEDEKTIKEILRKKLEEDSGYDYSGDEDDDQNFIDKRQQLFDDIEAELEERQKGLKAVRPEGFQARDLNRETGGLEAKEHKEKHVEDAWDKRAESLAEINEENAENFSDSSKSTLRQSFIHKKKQEKKNKEAAKDGAEYQMSYVQKVKNMREDKSSSNSKFDDSARR
jgi:hypothetical protein